MRLWPLILIATVLCLIIGAVGMLPDDYENLSHSVIASSLFSENILSAITTKNYWDTVNEFKPLMHMWYVGVLVEFYLLFPLLVLILRWISNRFHWNSMKILRISLWILFFGSFILYLIPVIPSEHKFYYVPYRLFELLAGGLVGVYFGMSGSDKIKPIIGKILIAIVLVILCSSLFTGTSSSVLDPVSGKAIESSLIPQNILLIATVAVTCLLLISKPQFVKPNKTINAIAFIGVISFSIFVWHQILLAFYRYYISSEMSVAFVIILFLLTLGISVLTYFLVEKKIKYSRRNFAICVLLLCMSSASSLWINVNAGVIRDVPELNIVAGETHKGMFAEYCDRVFAYDNDFRSEDKIKVLVEGISFGRDFANILLESNLKDDIEISYIYKHNEKYKKRYNKCDYLFTFKDKKDVPDYVWENLNPKAKVFGLGTKSFGDNNGQVYQHRHDDDYLHRSVKIDRNFYQINNLWKKHWGVNNYIDFIEIASTGEDSVRVFTDDGKFISQDTLHLTPEGAQWYAKAIDWSKIFNK